MQGMETMSAPQRISQSTTSTSESSAHANLDQEDAVELTLPKDDLHLISNQTMHGVRGCGLPCRVANLGSEQGAEGRDSDADVSNEAYSMITALPLSIMTRKTQTG